MAIKTRSFRGLLGAMAAGLALLVSAATASADKIHLKDGRVLEGRIVKEEGNVVWFAVVSGKLEQTQFFTTDEIKKIERDTPATEESKSGIAKPEMAKSSSGKG